MNGVVFEVLPDSRFASQAGQRHELVAYPPGNAQTPHPHPAGDKVSLELSPYDLSKGRITFRHVEGRPPPQLAARRNRH